MHKFIMTAFMYTKKPLFLPILTEGSIQFNKRFYIAFKINLSTQNLVRGMNKLWSVCPDPQDEENRNKATMLPY